MIGTRMRRRNHLGVFQADLADLDASSLVETIPDFHNTKKRLERLKEICEEDQSID